MILKHKQSREALEHFLTNVLELNSESPAWEALNHNGNEDIEDFVNITDTDIRNLCYKIFTKELEYLFIGHQNLIQSFIDHF